MKFAATSSGLTDINHGLSHGVLDANLNHSPSMLTPDPQYLAPCLLFLILNAISGQIQVRACTSNHSPFATCPCFAASHMDIVPEPEGVLFSVLPITPVLIQTKSSFLHHSPSSPAWLFQLQSQTTACQSPSSSRLVTSLYVVSLTPPSHHHLPLLSLVL
jgi:hypothetical protein